MGGTACLVDGLVDALDAVAQAVHGRAVGLQLRHLAGQLADGAAGRMEHTERALRTIG